MSAAAVARTLERPARGFCRASHAWFYKLPRLLTKTEYVCAGLILDTTVGWGRDCAPLSIQQFMAVANVSRRAVEMAIDSARDKGVIRWTATIDGDRSYSIQPEWLPTQEPGGRATGKCSHCGVTGAVEIEPEGFAQVPHAYFRKLPRSVEYAELVIIGVILDSTIGYQAESAQITNEVFMAATGLSLRRVQEATAACEQKGLIEIEVVSGKHGGSRYRVLPEAFGGLEVMAARRVNRDKRESVAKAKEPESPEVPEPQEATPAVECQGRKVFARCLSCRTVGLVRLISSALPELSEVRRATAPPKEATGPPGEANGPRAEVVEEVRRFMAGWARSIGELPELAIAREVLGALGGASVEDFKAVCEKRSEYLRRYAKSYKVFVPFAKKLGELWAAMQPTPEETERRRRRREEDAKEAQARFLHNFEQYADKEEAEFWSGREECDEELRAVILRRFPQYAARIEAARRRAAGAE